jgi:hypothetical protein
LLKTENISSEFEQKVSREIAKNLIRFCLTEK